MSIVFATTQLLTLGNLCVIVVGISHYVAVDEALKLCFALKSRDSVIDAVNRITTVHTITLTDGDKFGDEYLPFGWLFLIKFAVCVCADLQ